MSFRTPNETEENIVGNGKFNGPAPSAYINVWLPANTESGRKKFGTIKLYDQKADEANLVQFLQADDANLLLLWDSLMIDFKMASSNDKNAGFIIPKARINPVREETGHY